MVVITQFEAIKVLKRNQATKQDGNQHIFQFHNVIQQY